MKKFLRTSVKERCHGNQFCGARRRQVGIPRLYCFCWHFTTVGTIAKPILIRRLPMYHLHLVKFLCSKLLRSYGEFAGVSGCAHAKVRTFALFSPEYRLTFTKHLTNIERLVGIFKLQRHTLV